MLLGNSLMAKRPAAGGGGSGPGNNAYSNALLLADFRTYNGGIVDKEVHWLVGKDIEARTNAQLQADHLITNVAYSSNALRPTTTADGNYLFHQLLDDSWITADNMAREFWFYNGQKNYYPNMAVYLYNDAQTLVADSVYLENETYLRLRHSLRQDDGTAEEVGWLSAGAESSYGLPYRVVQRPRVATGTYQTKFYNLNGPNGGREADLVATLEHDLTGNALYTNTRHGGYLGLRDNYQHCYAFGVWKEEDYPTDGLIDVIGTL